MTIDYRELRSAAELAPLPELEALVWGAGGAVVAVHMLAATISEGGMAIGAFDGQRLVGSVYGFASVQPGVLHSHYLAVDPDYRMHGLGLALKQKQREWCMANGRTMIRWTFDPLRLGNAHINMRSLGAVAVRYEIDLYGPMGGINGQLPSDRLVVEWDLVNGRPQWTELVEVDVPAVDADGIGAASDTALSARLELRGMLQPLMAEGWQVTDVDRDRRRYTLSR